MMAVPPHCDDPTVVSKRSRCGHTNVVVLVDVDVLVTVLDVLVEELVDVLVDVLVLVVTTGH